MQSLAHAVYRDYVNTQIFCSGHHLHDPNLLFVDTMINIAKGFDLDSAAEWAEKKILLLKEYIDCLKAWHCCKPEIDPDWPR